MEFFITIETYLKNIEKNNQQKLENIPNSRLLSRWGKLSFQRNLRIRRMLYEVRFFKFSSFHEFF